MQETQQHETLRRPVQIPQITLPKGGGALQGIGEKFQANPVTGTGSVSVPIALSPGRAGFGPELALSYSSGLGNGPFGLGWDIGLATIRRKTEKGLPRYLDGEESDVFILSGGEDLVPVLVREGDAWVREIIDDPEYATYDGERYTVHRYRPRIEGLYARIERWVRRSDGDTHWRTIASDNRTTLYGRTPAARIADPSDGRKVFQWLIERSYDDRGNVVDYEYTSEDAAGVDAALPQERNRLRTGGAFAQKYLKRILYGNTLPFLIHLNDAGGSGFDEEAWAAANRWHFQLVLDYGEHAEHDPTPHAVRPWPVRADPFSTYRAGFEIRTYRLCRRFLMFHDFESELGPGPRLVRSTDLAYDEGPAVSLLREVVHWSYAPGQEPAAMPPVRFTYSRPQVDESIRTIEPEELHAVPDGQRSRWFDLEGEGLTGVLTQHDDAWYYQPNLGGGRFGPRELVASLPSIADVGDPHQQFSDLHGDGRVDLRVTTPALSGYYERNEDGEWDPFVPFHSIPGLDWGDPNLRAIDLTGDGRPDLLITEDDCLRWYASAGEDGYEAAQRLARALDEEAGPAIVFADATQSIHLADMTGDGLTDIVRIRNGEICYWPNTGYGTFGAKVTMDRAPVFDAVDQFDPRRIRLGDIDGTGTTDVLYIGPDRLRYWQNQAGNGWSEAHELREFPRVDDLAAVDVMDLLGAGTACVVWSSTLPADRSAPVHYIALMSEGKPYLLTEMDNGVGATTRIRYAPSTRFYLCDRQAGRPWVTRLPFPVHVVERVETYDAISRNRFVTLYAYHHGYFDGEEREFRGFGMVEQWDTEHYAEFGTAGLFPVGANHADEASHVPPVYTKTWFHNGFFADRQRISRQYETEYYRGDADAWLLPDTVLPPGLTAEEQREACRALKGRMLRQEVYALDGTAAEAHPYTVTETTYHIRTVQPRAGQRHASFYVCRCESLAYQYERDPADPRITHTHTLEIDRYGNVRKAATVAYPRRRAVLPEQARMHVTYVENDLIHLDATPWTYRTGLVAEQRSYEIQGLGFRGLWEKAELAAAIAGAPVVPYTTPAPPPGGPVQKRLLDRTRTLYYRADLDPDAPLPFGQAGSLGIAHSEHRLTFTADILAMPELGGRITPELLREAGYRNDVDGDSTHWWAPSDTPLFDPLAAPGMFYLPVGSRDPFGAVSTVRYDRFNILPVEVTDALGNTISARNDYRLLLPWEMTDPNGNRTQVAFDVRGLVAATAVIGREGEGDTLAEPTTHVEYDLFAYHRTRDTDRPQPNWARTRARVRHGDPTSPWHESYAYSDGLGRVVMAKVQAEDGPAPVYGPDGDLLLDAAGQPVQAHSTDRWIGTGATIFNNKGLPVRQYEPFFDSRPDYTDEAALARIGVSPTLHYDALGRVIRTDLPDGSFTRVEFDAWRQLDYDANDTALEPGNRWYAERGAPDPTGPEPSDPGPRAAYFTARHAGTPTIQHLDVLGRAVVSVAHNRRRRHDPDGAVRYEDEFIPTRTELDVEGNPLAIYDGRRCEGLTREQAATHRGNRVMLYRYAMGGLTIHQESMDAGRRWTLANVPGNPAYMWDDRGHRVRTRYDALQRPTHVTVDVPRDDGTMHTITAERIVYGEELPDAVARAANLRGRSHLHFDGAGLVKNAAFDFKGNLIAAERRLAADYLDTPDWSALDGLPADALEAAAPLAAETFATFTTYDALDRPTSVETPDGSVHLPTYNKANLLEGVRVRLRGASAATAFVEIIEYNARGQRTAIEYANGVRTTYAYDDRTFRLVRLHTARRHGANDLQDLHYTYDAVGNLAEVTDEAITPVFFRNERVDARSCYVYDALYRVVEATGRESAAAAGLPTHEPIPQAVRIPAHDHALRNYTRRYDYDPAGNTLRVEHIANGGSWTRTYAYARDSNRLLSYDVPGGGTAAVEYDAHGNMLGMPHLAGMAWDHRDQLAHVHVQPGSDVFHRYDSTRNRVRKVWLHDGYRDERIYLGAYELYRRYAASGTTPETELQTLHVMDDVRRICMVETTTIEDGSDVADPQPRFRYQLSNHVGSATVELDEAAEVITYEEYHPYGTTAYHARNGTIEVSAKRYRYTGMERDEETGLNYHTARYYATWLGRWCSADPIGIDGGFNLYGYASQRPTSRVDPEGTSDGESGGWINWLRRQGRAAWITLGFSIGQAARPATPPPPPPTPPPIEAPAGPTNPDGPPAPFETDRLRRHIEDERIRIDGTTGGSSPPPPPRPRPRRPSARAELDRHATRIAAARRARQLRLSPEPVPRPPDFIMNTPPPPASSSAPPFGTGGQTPGTSGSPASGGSAPGARGAPSTPTRATPRAGTPSTRAVRRAGTGVLRGVTNFLGPVGDVVDAYEFVTAESWAERGELLLDVAVSVVSAPFAAFTAASQRNQTEAHRCELIGSGVCRNLAAFVRENPDATPEAINQFLEQEAVRVRTGQAEPRRERQQQQQQQQQDPPVDFLPIEEQQRFQGGRI